MYVICSSDAQFEKNYDKICINWIKDLVKTKIYVMLHVRYFRINYCARAMTLCQLSERGNQLSFVLIMRLN